MSTYISGFKFYTAFALFLFLSFGKADAQNVVYGNEWINYSQPYYKLQVAKDGLYRIPASALSSAGISGVNPDKIQMFRRGKELAIYVKKTGGNTLDYIEFYGQRNDGVLDSALYREKKDQPHQLYSFYTDSASYFLTWGSANGIRMTEKTSVPTGLTEEPRHYAELLRLKTDKYYYGYFYNMSAATIMTWHDMGEAYGTLEISKSRKDTVAGLSFIDNTGRKPTIQFGVLGEFFFPHKVQFALKPPASQTRILTNSKSGSSGILSFPAWNYINPSYELEYSDIHPNGVLHVRTLIPDSANHGNYTTNHNQVALSYIKLRYARFNNLENKDRIIFTDSLKTTPSYFLFENPPVNAFAYDITDPYNVVRIQGTTSGAKKGFVIDAAAGGKKVLIATSPANTLIQKIRQSTFTQINPGNTNNYIIITHKVLRKPVNSTYTDPPADYAAYRASPAGGGYNPLVVNIDQVYDQYHYGEKSAQGITNFMKVMIKNGKPEHLFLIGKALDHFDRFTTRYRATVNLPFNPLGEDLVPTAGMPPSDLLFTSDWKNDTVSFVPKVSTGRLTAMTPTDVVSYLEKIKQHEMLGVEDWRKNILHLGGGQKPSEINTFSRYLRNYENKAEGPLLGARVTSFLRKDNGIPVYNININKELNAGLSLITFFGHSSTTTSDIDIGMASNPVNGYNNTGKYPMILLNGCVSGNPFIRRSSPSVLYSSFGEDWLMTPQKGALAFIGNTDRAVPHPLNIFSSNFYTKAFTDPLYFGKPIGEIHQAVIAATQDNGSGGITGSIINIGTLNTMMLQGDPVFRLFAPEKPDYAFQTNGVTIEANPAGSTLSAASEKFNLVLAIKNRGKAIEDSLTIRVRRTIVRSGQVILYPKFKVAPVYNEATHTLTINSSGVNAFGENKFEIFLESDSVIAELDETNNTEILQHYFNAASAIALLPAEYSIVSGTTVKLVGQSATLLSGKRDYYFELDTDKNFKSSFKKSGVVQNATILPTWTVNLLSTDSLVYYWRIRFNSINAGEDTIWSSSSFRYIANSSNGWSQSEGGQFVKDEKSGIIFDNPTEKWEFSAMSRNLELRTVGGDVRFAKPYGIILNGSNQIEGCFAGAGPRFLVMVINNSNLNPVTDIPGYAANLCGIAAPLIKDYYTFPVSTTLQQNNLSDFLSKIPDGYYVAMVSVNKVPFSTFTPALKTAFGLIGSTMINSLTDNHPYAILGKKGTGSNPGTLIEEKKATTATPLTEALTITYTLQGSGTEGSITSTIIGPAKQWTTLHHTVRTSGADNYDLDVYGIDTAGVRSATPVLADVTNRTASLNIPNIDPARYPYLQLVLTKKDPAATAPQLKQWMVLYQGVPEGIIRTDLVDADEYSDLNNQAANGKIDLKFAFSNISKIDFDDSLTIYRSVRSGSNIVMRDKIKVKPLLQGDSVYFNFDFSTAQLKGNNILRVDVNPKILPEQYYFNNFLELPFTVPNRNLHPVLDVAFDGIRIMDGDFVSPSPRINIVLKDEDRFDFVQDPNNLQVFLRRPGSPIHEQIDLNDASLVTLPDMSNTTGDKRDFVVIFHPKNLPDGVYNLKIQGRDNAGQKAGFDPYSVNFEVKNESSITHFYPYPNPFTSKTRFVFTVTGLAENIPRNMKVQIMTLTGKVVREIQKEELGLVHIGNNMSEPWDGTDEYGDKLANGVYLYRVVMEKSPLEEMKHRRSGGDKAFTKEYGKLYILR